MAKLYKLKTDINDDKINYEEVVVESSESVSKTEKQRLTINYIDNQISKVNDRITVDTARKAELEAMLVAVKKEADKVTNAIKKI